MEQDCPPYFSTYRGLEEGTPKLLSLFEKEKIPVTFFTTGEVARRFPDTIRRILSQGHELGCHGDTHERFDRMDFNSAREEIQKSSRTLRDFSPVISFRAPNLVFPEPYLKILEGEGYRLDSSQAKYKRGYHKNGTNHTSLTRVAASATSSVLRLPKWIRFSYLGRLTDPVILFVHPWEFVDFRKSRLRLDCRFRTGDTALQCLKENIQFFRARHVKFLRMRDLLCQ